MKISFLKSSQLKKYGSTISVIGALVLFFSWSVKNTLYEKYAHLKSSIQSAEQNFNLYSTLHELRGNINSLATEIVQQRFSRDASQYQAGLTGNHDIDESRHKFDMARLNAYQLRELMDFTGRTYDVSHSVRDQSKIADSIKMTMDEIMALRDSVRVLEKAVENIGNVRPEDAPFSLFPAINNYCDFWHYASENRVRFLYPRIVDLSNKRSMEVHGILLKAEDRAALAESWSTYLYILGTLMALGGQAIDKLIKTDQATENSGHELRSIKRKGLLKA